jgi:hypothetical protein
MKWSFSSNTGAIRVGALAAIAAGGLRVVGALIPADQQSIGLAVLYLVTDIGIALGLIAWYFDQHASIGALGSAGFALGIVGVLIIRSNGAIPGVVLYPPGALLVAVGIGVLAYCAWRARRLPVWMLGLLVCSALAGIVGSLVPGFSALFVLSGVMFGSGFAAVGTLVWHDVNIASASHRTGLEQPR